MAYDGDWPYLGRWPGLRDERAYVVSYLGDHVCYVYLSPPSVASPLPEAEHLAELLVRLHRLEEKVEALYKAVVFLLKESVDEQVFP